MSREYSIVADRNGYTIYPEIRLGEMYGKTFGKMFEHVTNARLTDAA